MTVPCKDCPDRFPACHDHCPKYKAYKEEREAYKAAKRAERDIDNTIYESTVRKRVQWAMKRKRQG